MMILAGLNYSGLQIRRDGVNKSFYVFFNPYKCCIFADICLIGVLTARLRVFIWIVLVKEQRLYARKGR